MENQINFKTKFLKELVNSYSNFYFDNYDKERFGNLSFKDKTKNYFSKLLFKLLKKLKIKDSLFKIDVNENFINLSAKHIDDFDYLYSRAEDEKSKETLMNLCLYRILGHKKVMLFSDNKHVKKFHKMICKLKTNKKSLISNKWQLFHYDLTKLGYNINLFNVPGGLLVLFGLGQYTHEHCMVEKGDYVIDAGACWGDSALLFASKTGTEGKVFSFEFMPEHKKIMEINLSLNPDLKDQINLIMHPLWDISGEKVPCVDWGPGSRIRKTEDVQPDLYAETITIDDFISKNHINKIDFIKMDIEGAELKALFGAKETIKKFKPKLAICLYHKITDFRDIPEYLDSLNLGYTYYLGHYTSHLEETILYAKIEKQL